MVPVFLETAFLINLLLMSQRKSLLPYFEVFFFKSCPPLGLTTSPSAVCGCLNMSIFTALGEEEPNNSKRVRHAKRGRTRTWRETENKSLIMSPVVFDMLLRVSPPLNAFYASAIFNASQEGSLSSG